MLKRELAQRIKALAELQGEFRLRSGKASSRYFDKYRFESDPEILAAIAEELARMLPPRMDAVAGLELGGIPLATAVSLRSGLPCLFVRKQAKEYGTCRAVEGNYSAGQHVAVIEDVVTSGGAVVAAIDQLRAAGLVVNHVLCVIDREAGGREAIEAQDCAFLPLFGLRDFSDAA
jgi:orotate phosphoribosyltransferase